MCHRDVHVEGGNELRGLLDAVVLIIIAFNAARDRLRSSVIRSPCDSFQPRVFQRMRIDMM